jgi:hypothetical protein
VGEPSRITRVPEMVSCAAELTRRLRVANVPAARPSYEAIVSTASEEAILEAEQANVETRRDAQGAPQTRVQPAGQEDGDRQERVQDDATATRVVVDACWRGVSIARRRAADDRVRGGKALAGFDGDVRSQLRQSTRRQHFVRHDRLPLRLSRNYRVVRAV